MPKLPNDNDRCLITLLDKDGDVIEKKTIKKSLLKLATALELQSNLDRGDKIIIETAEI